jgi:DNA-binding SARP family transcriptional activator
VSHRTGAEAGRADCRRGIDFGILGTLDARVDGQPVRIGSAKHRVLLAALLLRAGQPVSAGELAEAIWADDRPDDPRRALQLHVTRLRRLLASRTAEHVIATCTDGYQITVRPDQVDLGRFRQALRRAGQAAERGDPDGEAESLAEALDQWRGKPLADVPSELLHRDVVPQLHEQWLQASEQRFDAELRRGRHTEFVAQMAALAAEHPLRERLWAQLMTALYRSSQRGAALAAYHTARRYLADQLGIDPGDELQALHAAVLAGRPLRPAHGGHAPELAALLPPVPRQLPAVMPSFTGRAAELARLDTLLAGQPSRPGRVGGTPPMLVCVIVGTAGIGKTALALHWARRVADSFPDGQLWVNLRGYDRCQAMTAEQALKRFLRALGVSDAEIPLDLDDQASLYRSLLDGRRVLVVLDNASSAEQVRLLLPGAPGCLVLVTSRNQLAGLVATEGAHLEVLDLLTRREARQLLALRLGAERVHDQEPAAEEIVSLCARLPLALAIAAARAAAHPEFGLPALAAELRGARGSLDAFTGPDPATEMRAVFSWSYQVLSVPARRLFRLLGLHPGPDVTAAVAASLAGAPVAEVRPVLAELCDAHLVTEHSPGRYTVHDLLRAYAVELSQGGDLKAERQQARRRLLDHYLHAAHQAVTTLHPHEDPVAPAPPGPGVTVEDLSNHRQALAWFSAEHHALMALIRDVAAAFPVHAWRLSWTLTEYLYRQGHWHDWVLVLRAALDTVTRPGQRAEQARAHRGLARAYARLGHLDSAEAHSTLALQLSESTSDRTELAQAHRAFGIVLEVQGRHREALAHDLQALDLFRTVGHQHGLARALNSVGWDYALLGDYPRALLHCQHALILLRELGDRQGQAATWDSLGYAHHHLGHHDQAITCQKYALHLFRDLGDRYKEAEILTHLGDTYRAAGETGQARTAWRGALEILTDFGHRDAGQVRARLGAG